MPDTTARSSINTALIIFVIAELVSMPYGCADAATNDLISKSADAFAHTIDLLVTLNLALFAVVGYFAKDRLARTGRKRRWQLWLLAGFFLISCISLYFAYQGQLEIAAQLGNGDFHYESLHFYVWQAFTLLLVTVLAGVFVASAL